MLLFLNKNILQLCKLICENIMGLDIDILNAGLKTLGIELSNQQISLLDRFETLVLDTNKKFNLTTITEEPDFTIKHIIDSLAAVPYIPQNASLLDIGTGGGFPSIPLAIARDDLVITAIDSTEKRINFVNSAISILELNNIKGKAIRAEDLSKEIKYDVVTARAVSSLPILLELSIPFLKTNGLFIAYKATDEEISLSSNALKQLNSEIKDVVRLTLPNKDKRCLILIQKRGETSSKYPRLYSQIKKKPL